MALQYNPEIIAVNGLKKTFVTKNEECSTKLVQVQGHFDFFDVKGIIIENCIPDEATLLQTGPRKGEKRSQL